MKLPLLAKNVCLSTCRFDTFVLNSVENIGLQGVNQVSKHTWVSVVISEIRLQYEWCLYRKDGFDRSISKKLSGDYNNITSTLSANSTNQFSLVQCPFSHPFHGISRKYISIIIYELSYNFRARLKNGPWIKSYFL